MRPWLITAKQELVYMRKYAEVMPLVEPVRESARIIRTCNLGVELVNDGSSTRSVLIHGRGEPNISGADLIQMFAVLRLGGHILAQCENHIGMNVRQLANTEITATVPSGTATATLLKKLNSAIGRYRGEISSDAQSYAAGLRALGKKIVQNAREDLRLSVDFAIAVILFRHLPSVFTIEQLQLLHTLITTDGLLERVRRCTDISRILERDKRTELHGRRIRLLTERYSLTCPKARAQLVEQYSQPTPCAWRPIRYVPLFDRSAEGWVEFTDSVPKTPKRTPSEELAYLHENFPGLCGIAMRRTAEEQEQRRIKKMIRRLMRVGVPVAVISDCMKDGLVNDREIVQKYTTGKLPTAVFTEVISNPVIRRKVVTEDGEEEHAATEAGYQTKEQFLDSITFSPATVQHITEAGLTVRDVVYGICKGFDFGKGVGAGAVGNSHYRGPIIRRNLARHCGNPDKILDYLGRVDLLRKFGGNTRARKKDGAMSIKTNPDNLVGTEILHTLNGAFHRMKMNGKNGK